MNLIHRYIGWSIVIALALLAIYGLGARLFRREDPGTPFWGLLYYTETVLVIQIIAGVVLLFMGGRVGTGFDLHYFYGSLFPIIALVGGRIFTMRREDAEEPYSYVPIALGAFVAFGLTTRALMTGLGFP